MSMLMGGPLLQNMSEVLTLKLMGAGLEMFC